MRRLFEWFLEQRGWLPFAVAVGFYVVALIPHFGFDRVWPFGYVMGTVLAVLGIFTGK